MARVTKIDNVWKKRFEREEKKRIINVRNKLVYFLIVCEGEKTEPNYFKALEKELPNGTVELDVDGTGRNTLGLVEYAIQKNSSSIRKYDRIWVVFDKDDFPDTNFNGAIIKANSNNVNVAWSNEAFELWFLLHFQFVNTGMKRDQYKAYLEREIKSKLKNNDFVYLKNDPSTFSLLKIHGNQAQAIEWAEKLLSLYNDQRHATHNPCTLVHKLILELLNPKEVLKKMNGEAES